MGEYFKETRLFTEMVHTFDNDNDSLSEGGALAVVVRDFTESSHQTRNDKHFPRLMRQSEARLRLACPRLARRVVAPHGRGRWWRESPYFGR